MGGNEVTEGIAAELLVRRARELPRDARFGHNRQSFDGGSVTALDQGLRGLAGLQVDRREWTHQRGQRLHRGPHDDLLAVRDAGLDSAGSIRPAVEAALAAPALVVRLRAALVRARQPPAHLAPLAPLAPPPPPPAPPPR